MTAALRAEVLKHRSTRTDVALGSTMAALVVFVVLLHGGALPIRNISGRTNQLKTVFAWGQLLASLFGALTGALAITTEYRYGTIRATIMVTPRRWRVVIAKVATSTAIAACLGVVAAGIAIGAGAAALRLRDVPLALSAADDLRLVAGGAASAGLWAALGVGIGAIVRDQVPAVTGLCAWLLFVETVLFGDADIIGVIGRFTPGALGRAAIGQDSQLVPAIAVALLGTYAALTVVVAVVITGRRDVP